MAYNGGAMRPELLMPAGAAWGESIEPDMLVGVLQLVGGGTSVTEKDVSHWAPLERAIAYDWAMREHLAASDNGVRRRPRPFLIGITEVVHSLAQWDSS